MANYQLPVGQTVELHVAGVNGAGQLIPALPNNGIPTWTTDHATKTGLLPSPDGNTCSVKGLATQVGAIITVTAVEPGPSTITTTFTIDIVAATVASLTINPATPVQTPGDIDERQKSASGRYLGIGFSSPPNA